MSMADEAREGMAEDNVKRLNISSWLRWVWGLLFSVICLFPWHAYAADVFCGVDTDFSGTASNPCPEPDKDHDGWASSNKVGLFGAGVDCDDTNWWIQPGFETASGCGAGEYRTCQTDGTYTACAAISGFTCNTAGGATYWVDEGESDCSGAGTYADPEDWRCWSDPDMVGYHAPGDGDCIVFQPGTYDDTWDDGGTVRQFYINGKDGTLTNPIVFRSQPGAIPGYAGKVLIQGAGTTPTPVFPWFIIGSDYTRTIGFEIDGTGGFSGAGILMDGSTDPQAYLNYIHNIDGTEDNNVSCVKCQVDTVGCYAHHNIVRDCYEVGAAADQNNVQVRTMDDTGDVRFWYNIVPNSVVVGACFDNKHSEDTATTSIRGNFCKNVAQYGIGTQGKDLTARNNWITDCDAYALMYSQLIGDANGWFKNINYTYNTVQRCSLSRGQADWDELTNHRTCNSGTCNPGVDVTGCCYPNVAGSAGVAASSLMLTDHNIASDDNASYDGDEGDGMSRYCEYNCTHGERAASLGKVLWTNNVYYSSGTSDLRFGWFGQAGGGADYGSLTDWQAAGFDAGSVQADPSLDADGISATYPDHGWSVGIFTDVTPASTGVTTGGGNRNVNKRRRKR